MKNVAHVLSLLTSLFVLGLLIARLILGDAVENDTWIGLTLLALVLTRLEVQLFRSSGD